MILTNGYHTSNTFGVGQKIWRIHLCKTCCLNYVSLDQPKFQRSMEVKVEDNNNQQVQDNHVLAKLESHQSSRIAFQINNSCQMSNMLDKRILEK
jgi:hypothetical protein